MKYVTVNSNPDVTTRQWHKTVPASGLSHKITEAFENVIINIMLVVGTNVAIIAIIIICNRNASVLVLVPSAVHVPVSPYSSSIVRLVLLGLHSYCQIPPILLPWEKIHSLPYALHTYHFYVCHYLANNGCQSAQLTVGLKCNGNTQTAIQHSKKKQQQQKKPSHKAFSYGDHIKCLVV